MRRTQREARLLLLFALAAVGCLIGLVAAWHHRTPLAANQHTINQLTDELALARAQTVHAKPSPQRHGSSAQPSILVVMNSVARANQAPYLLHTLQSITREATAMVGPFSDSLTVLIRNPHPVSRPHPVFKEAEAKFSRSAAPVSTDLPTVLLVRECYACRGLYLSSTKGTLYWIRRTQASGVKPPERTFS